MTQTSNEERNQQIIAAEQALIALANSTAYISKVESIKTAQNPFDQSQGVEALIATLATEEAAKTLKSLIDDTTLFNLALDSVRQNYLNLIEPKQNVPGLGSNTLVRTMDKIEKAPYFGADMVPQESPGDVIIDESKSEKPVVDTTKIPTILVPSKPESVIPAFASPAASIDDAVNTPAREYVPYAPKKESRIATYLGIGLLVGLVGMVSYVTLNRKDTTKTAPVKTEVAKTEPYKFVGPIQPVEKPYVPEVKPVETYKPVEPKPIVPEVKPEVPYVKPVEPKPVVPVEKKLTASELEQKLLNHVFDSQNKDAVATFGKLIAIDDSYNVLAQTLGWNGSNFDDNKFTNYERSLPDVLRSIYDSFDEGFGSSVSNELENKSGIKAVKNFERYLNALKSTEKQELFSDTYNMKKLAVTRLVEHAHKSEE